jgi:replicative DNA helicase
LKICDICDNQSETGIISSLIHHPEFILHSEYLKPKHFYNKENACIYWAIYELYKSGVDNIDSFNLTTMLNSNVSVKKTVENFNISSVQELIDLSSCIARHKIEEYKIIVSNVLTMSFKRDLYKKLQQFETFCFDDSCSLGDLNYKVYEDLNKLAEEYVVTNEIELFGEKIEDLWQETVKRQVGKSLYGIPSKFELLNKYCPYDRGELIIVAAPRKTGKSMFMLNEATHKIKNKVPTLYIDTEMSSRNFMERMLSHITQIPVVKIKSGNYTASEEILIKEAIEFIKSTKFIHMYNPSWTNDKIYSICKILQYKIGLQFVIYDYLKSNAGDSSGQYNDLGNKTNFLKNDIAGGLNLAVLCGSQLNRNNEIGDSYKIEQYASSVINLIPKTENEIIKDGADCGNYKLFVKLNRNGEQMSDSESEYIDLSFNGNYATILQAKTQHNIDELPI